MEFGSLILVGLTILFVTYVASKMDQKASNGSEDSVQEKRCPGHKWQYKEQPGMPGTYFVICDWCKKKPGQLE